VKHKRVYALEANSYFSRPGPRLVRGVEVLAKILHPSMAASREAERAVLPIAAAAVAGKRAASV
jgi:iron complex transport system substrate-binding protein